MVCKPCRRAFGFASSPPGAHHKADPVALPPPAASPAFGSAANFPSLGSAGWRARRRRNAGLSARAARARTLLPPRSGSRGRAGIPATSNCPVSVAAGGVAAGPPRGAGQVGAQLPQRLTGAAGRPDSMNVSLSELRELAMDRGGLACCDSWGLKESDTKGHCHPRASSAKTRGFHTQLDEGPETP